MKFACSLGCSSPRGGEEGIPGRRSGLTPPPPRRRGGPPGPSPLPPHTPAVLAWLRSPPPPPPPPPPTSPHKSSSDSRKRSPLAPENKRYYIDFVYLLKDGSSFLQNKRRPHVRECAGLCLVSIDDNPQYVVVDFISGSWILSQGGGFALSIAAHRLTEIQSVL